MKQKKIIPIIIIAVLAVTIIISAVVLFALINKPENEVPPSETTAEKEETSEEAIDSVSYKIEKEDVSFSNKEQNLYLGQYFEKVVILDEGESFQNINKLISQEAESFIKEAKENEAFVLDEKYASDMRYTNHHSAHIAKNSDGILSIKMTTEWFMGGVANMDTYGLNYDLNTGEALKLNEYLKMSKTKTEEILKSETKKHIKDGYYENAEEIIDNYKLEDFSYYISDGKLYLCYPTYTLAPGAAGAVIIETDVPLD